MFTPRNFAKRLIRKTPFEITRREDRATQREKRARALFSASYLGQLPLEAETIFDVGVYKGTKELYDAFPDKEHVLIDPLRNAEDRLEHKPRSYAFLNCALGPASGTITLHEMSGKTSTERRTALTNGQIEHSYDVKVRTFDDVIEELSCSSPYGVKIDTEGSELKALQGLNRNVGRVEFLILEVSVKRRFEDGYYFSDIIGHLAAKGFEFFNFLNRQHPSPRFYDCLFLKRDSPIFSQAI